jgi:PAS domain-containing protein
VQIFRVWAEVIRHIESRHREYILECRIRTANGEYMWVENHVTTSFDRKGKPQRVNIPRQSRGL